jgi:biopolymer transport protein ExbB
MPQRSAAVRLHTGNFLFADAKADGSDIRFVAADDKTPLKHHIEVFDAANQLAIIWVQVPRLAAKSSAEHVWLYSGNATAPAADDAKGVYSPSQRLLLNFGETDGAFKDATAYANLVAGREVAHSAAGLAGGSALFNGRPLSVAMLESARIQPGGGAGLSMMAWVKPAAAQKAQLFGWGGLTVQLDDTQVQVAFDRVRLQGGVLEPGRWHHVGVTLGDRLVLYVDGVEVAARPASLREFAGEFVIGQGYAGEIDVLELAAVARPALWLQAQAAQGPDGKLLVYGDPEQDGASGEDHGSYLNVLINSLTLDAKIVIVILAFMFAVAAYVMVSKALMVGRVDRHNAAFIETFEGNPRPLLDPHSSEAKALLAGAAGKHSSLARLYATGMRELRRRVGDHSSQVDLPITSLSAEAIAAIKASIDSTLIRENQRLNRLMVLLTIAISGGPFLGLLGTVVGVMITFAAIAASGDVNINAIAPGIAAALLATVAGLTVAIPALFGYNYLLTRIKNITADMQAFSDEFVTRMAEAHNQ